MLPFKNQLLKELSLSDFVDFIVRFCLFAAVHSLGAMNRTKLFFSRTGGEEPRIYRLSYNLVSLAMFAWVMSAYRSSAVLYFAPGIWSLVMYGAQLIVAVILLQCLRQTGAGNFLGTSQIRNHTASNQTLITTGCYAHIRHPLYFYSLLFMVLNPVMTAQWLLLTVLSLIYFVVGGMIEERRLAKIFGEAYLDYQRRVPFLVPNPEKTMQAATR